VFLERDNDAGSGQSPAQRADKKALARAGAGSDDVFVEGPAIKSRARVSGQDVDRRGQIERCPNPA